MNDKITRAAIAFTSDPPWRWTLIGASWAALVIAGHVRFGLARPWTGRFIVVIVMIVTAAVLWGRFRKTFAPVADFTDAERQALTRAIALDKHRAFALKRARGRLIFYLHGLKSSVGIGLFLYALIVLASPGWRWKNVPAAVVAIAPALLGGITLAIWRSHLAWQKGAGLPREDA